MEEALENAQGTPFFTLFKAVCKRWLLIGFSTVIGALFGCIFALAALPLTKDVYQVSLYLNPSNASIDKTISYYNETVIANIKNYLEDTDYKYNVFLDVQDKIFGDISESEKEAKFKTAVSISVDVSASIYVMNLDRGTSETILNAFVKEAKSFVAGMMAEMNTGNISESDIVGVAVVARAMVKADPKETEIEGYIGIKNRVTAVAVGAVLGILAGAGAAVCAYYFNNRLNSAQMLNSMGFDKVYVDKKRKNGSSVYRENAVRYNFVIGKEGGKIITFITPFKTDETSRALAAQAESMREYGYRTAEMAQNGQTREGWRKAFEAAAAENDFVLVDAREAENFDCAVPGALGDGVTVVIDQKNTKLKQIMHTAEIIETAKLKTLAVFVVNTREDFVL